MFACMKPRVAALIGLVALAVIVIGIGGYWYVKVHTRISQASLESQVLTKEGGRKATCIKKDSNAAHWLCAVTVTRRVVKCVKTHVRPWGSVSVLDGYLKCRADPALAPLFPKATHKKKKKKHKKKQQSSA
jgi:hypothetical protein